ncbi:T9SS type A sorting domain-containing protein [Lishizhenia sp.]|uniref:T9SS type A sorting domain-containing protein n=1 Tax=Lishizhenia sp. TaxID=2497594 RepID=UPI00299CE70E|nr:T9SS type A sorting domain-containing protein [Lishizhenia sp.]MDX1445219.1 T9SS type A sorting domain-containing protein [Lishizhenia sp.]
MNKLLLLAGLFLTSNISAQMNSFVELNENSLQCTVNSNGELFSNLANSGPGFSVEFSQSLYTIFSNRIVLAGLGPNGDLAMTKPHGSNNLANGPLTVAPGYEFGPATITPAESNAWSQIFVVTQDEIDEFKNYHACMADPNCDATINFPNYQIPSSISNWPAHGDITIDQSFFLAPFYDADWDGNYNPEAGDYPCIKGDIYAWFVMNNYLTDPSVTTTTKGLEIHVEVYQFEGQTGGDALSNTVFVGYDVINRGTTPLSDFYLSNYTDFDLGYPLDDYMGTLPDINAYFIYNGDDYDETSSFGQGFLDHLPVQGVVSLNHDLSAAGYADVDVYTPVEYYNIMRGYHTDGSVKYFPGTQIATAFTFPYSTNTPYQWTEANSDGNGMVNTPGDRRMQGAVGPLFLDVGESISYDFAFVYAKEEVAGLGNEASISKLITDINTVQDYYDNQMTDCSGGFLTVEVMDEVAVNIYPNPTTELLFIETSDKKVFDYKLCDASGRVVISGQGKQQAQLDMSQLMPGVYYLTMMGEGKGVYKVVKQ